jgi:two-component system NarL family response regulator
MNVLVADDHALFRDGIISLLTAADHRVIGQVGDGDEAVKAAAELKPDLVLMDIEMPRLNGLEALEKIKEQSPQTRVVMLTVSDNDEHVMTAIEMGADGYLLKDLNSREFLECIRGLEHGNLAVTRKTATRLISMYQNLLKQGGGEKELLSSREVEVLTLVGEGLSTSDIAQRLYISENTVKYHVRNLLQKLGAHNRAEAISHAVQKGLIEAR